MATNRRSNDGLILRSALSRVATGNATTTEDLLRYDLAPAAGLSDVPALVDLDWDPPASMVQALARRTGVAVGHLRLMTIAGWVPWLLDGLEVAGQDVYDTYISRHSVLLRPGPGPCAATPSDTWWSAMAAMVGA